MTGLGDHALFQILADAIHARFDRHCWEGRFGAIDEMLSCDLARALPTELLLAMLTASLPCKSKLPSRPQFVQHVKDAIERRGENEPGLLDGLE